MAGEVRRPTLRAPQQRVDLREQSVLGDAGGAMDNRVSIINGPLTSLTAVNEDGAEGAPEAGNMRLCLCPLTCAEPCDAHVGGSSRAWHELRGGLKSGCMPCLGLASLWGA